MFSISFLSYIQMYLILIKVLRHILVLASTLSSRQEYELNFPRSEAIYLKSMLDFSANIEECHIMIFFKSSSVPFQYSISQKRVEKFRTRWPNKFRPRNTPPC